MDQGANQDRPLKGSLVLTDDETSWTVQFLQGSVPDQSRDPTRRISVFGTGVFFDANGDPLPASVMHTAAIGLSFEVFGPFANGPCAFSG